MHISKWIGFGAICRLLTAVALFLVFGAHGIGLAEPQSNTLTQDEIKSLRAQLARCWSPPVEATNANVIIRVRFQLKRDGNLRTEPIVLNDGSGELFQNLAESARRAVRSCQPFRLPLAKYKEWKDVEINFDPRRPGEAAK